MEEKFLSGKVAVITGAGGGIGRAMALRFAEKGAKVVVNDLGTAVDGSGASKNVADAVVEEIKAIGGEAQANYDSVTTIEGAYNIIYSALNKFGRLDVVVNNAGILRDRFVINMSESDWDSVIAVHLKGAFLLSRAAMRHFKVQSGGGRIINITSLVGMMGNAGQANYGAAKGGVIGLTKVLAQEGERFGVTCNAIAPLARTRMTQDLPIFAGVTDSEMGPQYVAPVATFLASEEAKGITGRVIGVEGGKIFAYKVQITPGVNRKMVWKEEEILSRWDEITKD
ncbi:MAG: SDR family oxidoreductase [Myxococcota bacterium]